MSESARHEPEERPNHRLAELEQRIRRIEAESEEAYGRFTGWDWAVCVIGGLLLPILLLMWFRP